jgi:rRNA maturation endonuclease Nob1
MIEIESIGEIPKQPEKSFKITCYNCKSIFKYEKSDVITLISDWVKCPICGCKNMA